MQQKLKELREKRGLSQAEVAQEIGISRQMYNKYERGDTEPSLSAIKALCTLYDISYDELLDSEEHTKKNACYEIDPSFGVIAVASPVFAFGTENYYAQIIKLLPHLLLSEKSRLLTAVAQSMTEEIELESKKRKSQLQKVNWNDIHIPLKEEAQKNMADFLQYAHSHSTDFKGKNWTREEMNER